MQELVAWELKIDHSSNLQSRRWRYSSKEHDTLLLSYNYVGDQGIKHSNRLHMFDLLVVAHGGKNQLEYRHQHRLEVSGIRE